MRLNRNTRIGLVLIGAALILLLFVKLFSALSSPPPAVANTAPANAPAQPVVFTGGRFEAKDVIPDHTLITTSMLKPSAAPRDSGSDASLYVSDLSNLVGYVTSRTVSKGESIKTTDLLGHISTLGASGLLRPGFRAQIVPIPNKTTLHDLVAVGDYVDIIGSFDAAESRVIVQNVRVLAVDVFGGDLAPVKAARRGDYVAAQPGAAPPPPPPGAPAGPGATPTPTPTPEGPPPAKPDPAITIEVTQKQAVDIALAQNSAGALDFLLRPKPAVATVGETRVVASTRDRLAPGAWRIKKQAGTPAKSTGGTTRVASNPPLMVPPTTIPDATTPVITPAQIPAPETYQIPVYGDGKVTRIDTVRKP